MIRKVTLLDDGTLFEKALMATKAYISALEKKPSKHSEYITDKKHCVMFAYYDEIHKRSLYDKFIDYVDEMNENL